ncbi:hypothetical protein KSC_090030 [Ktedonobacter sp. SOSP1-52]|nr:hypothetical protein KSC_090030 [Ktedonobacter sp. SOSP1-52]
MRISACVEAQQRCHAAQADQQSEQARAAHSFTRIEAEREKHNKKWIGGDEQAVSDDAMCCSP